MTERTRKIGSLLISGALLLGLGLAACDDDEGAAEQLGKKIDKGVEQAGDTVEEAADELERKTE